jgi:hypothetical protein
MRKTQLIPREPNTYQQMGAGSIILFTRLNKGKDNGQKMSVIQNL